MSKSNPNRFYIWYNDIRDTYFEIIPTDILTCVKKLCTVITDLTSSMFNCPLCVEWFRYYNYFTDKYGYVHVLCDKCNKVFIGSNTYFHDDEYFYYVFIILFIVYKCEWNEKIYINKHYLERDNLYIVSPPESYIEFVDTKNIVNVYR